MVYFAPSDLSALALSGGRSAALDILDLLRRRLNSDYTVFHGVHWSRNWRSIAVFGEADFVAVNNVGAAPLIEQKRSRCKKPPTSCSRLTTPSARTYSDPLSPWVILVYLLLFQGQRRI